MVKSPAMVPILLICFLVIGIAIPGFSSYQQQLIPILREIKTSSAPSVTEWKTYVRMGDFGGGHYVSLVQVAELLNGHLRWYPVSKQVDLSIHNRTTRFAFDSAKVWVNGRRHRLEYAPVMNKDGFWIPVSFFASKVFYRATGLRMQWPPVKKSSPLVGEDRGGGGNIAASTPHPSLPPQGGKGIIGAVRRIVIDPGHGGKDPGAISRHGVEEKAINLQLAEELAAALKQEDGYEVLLTRMDDSFVPLDERAKFANGENADLFISMHCNASLSSKLKGFEVYFLSEKASDPHADAVAQLENAPLALEGKTATPPSHVLAVLRSLVKNANINEASALGTLIDRQMGERLSEPSLGVKQAAFYVLRGAEMPAVLIEMGFLSNSKEERLLQKDAFRKKLVRGIAAGIAAYDQRKASERVSN
jgi:N-acetylmuramoyl-L-alanine amidase